MTQNELRLYLRKERFLRNGSVAIILIIVAIGLLLGKEGLYEYTPTQMQSDTTTFETQRYALMTQRKSEGIMVNPRWRTLLEDSGKMRKDKNIEEMKIGVEELKNKTEIKETLNQHQLQEALGKIEGTKDLVSDIEEVKRNSAHPEMIEEKISALNDVGNSKDLKMGEIVAERSKLMKDHPEIMDQIKDSDAALKGPLKDSEMKKLIKERDLLVKKAKEFEIAVRRGDLEYESENLFTAEDWYQRAFRAAKEIKSSEACLLIGSRFLSLTEKLHFSGGRPMTAEQCFKEALRIAIDQKSAEGCKKAAAALKLVNLSQQSEYAEDRARQFERENRKGSN